MAARTQESGPLVSPTASKCGRGFADLGLVLISAVSLMRPISVGSLSFFLFTFKQTSLTRPMRKCPSLPLPDPVADALAGVYTFAGNIPLTSPSPPAAPGSNFFRGMVG